MAVSDQKALLMTVLPDFEIQTPSAKVKIQPTSKDGRLRRDDVVMFEVLFQNILDVYFYCKDINRRWISCNTASLDLLNFSKISEVIGKKEEEFFPHQIAQAIRQDDLKILEQGLNVINRIELIPDSAGDLIWVESTKLPIFDNAEKVVGIIGITRPILTQRVMPKKFQLFAETIAFIRTNLASKIKISQLASAINLSESQYRRKFRAELQVSPQEFILQARLRAAALQLRDSSDSISQIAMDNGFADQSYFTRRFKQFFGETPMEYRKRWSSVRE